jgi:hypothetical protein
MSTAALAADLGGPLGLYDRETGTVWVQKGLPAHKARCTVVHEHIHKILGHGAPLSNREKIQREIAVHGVAARMLVPFHMLLTSMTRCASLREAAAWCGVDFDTFTTRLMGLTSLEQTMLEVCGRHCIGYQWLTEDIRVVPA